MPTRHFHLPFGALGRPKVEYVSDYRVVFYIQWMPSLDHLTTLCDTHIFRLLVAGGAFPSAILMGARDGPYFFRVCNRRRLQTALFCITNEIGRHPTSKARHARLGGLTRPLTPDYAPPYPRLL